MKLSVVIPAYNEAESIPETLQTLYDELKLQSIDHEIVVVNDNAKDNTLQVLEGLREQIPS
ncbi:MAG: glycosyltransferase, partial [Bacteroidetes bacterium]|nr:glycosyltransferase [Bacteroidota bacterium]